MPETWDGLQAVGVEARDLDAAALAALRGIGIDCYGLSVSDPAGAIELVGWGVRAIVTDRPGPIGARLGR